MPTCTRPGGRPARSEARSVTTMPTITMQETTARRVDATNTLEFDCPGKSPASRGFSRVRLTSTGWSASWCSSWTSGGRDAAPSSHAGAADAAEAHRREDHLHAGRRCCGGSMRCTLGRLITSVVFPKAGVAPTGFEPVFESRPRFRSQLLEAAGCLVPNNATRLKTRSPDVL